MDHSEGIITFIANPTSGASSRQPLSQQFYNYLLENGFGVNLIYTEKAGHAIDLARQAAEDINCHLVVAAGGDGTIREVAEGLQGDRTPLLILPAGTENLLAGELGYDERLSTIIETFVEGHSRPFDLGVINNQIFACVLGIGFDADIVDRVHKNRKGHIDYFDYLDPIWQTFWSHTFPKLNITVDDESVYQGPGFAFVGNVSRFGTGLKILREADYSDGLLDVCIFRCGSRTRLIKHSLLTFLRKHVGRGDVIYRQGKHIAIQSENSLVRSEVDGDPGPPLPLDIKIIPQAIHILKRKNAKPAGLRTRIVRALG